MGERKRFLTFDVYKRFYDMFDTADEHFDIFDIKYSVML